MGRATPALDLRHAGVNVRGLPGAASARAGSKKAKMVHTQTVAPAMGVNEQVAFLTTILESSTEYSIIAEDLDGTIVAWNTGARLLCGYEPSDVLGKVNAMVLYHPADVASGRAQAILDEVRRTGKWSGELQRVRKEGTHFTAFVITTRRRDAAGEPVGFTVISRDITESQRILHE